MLNGSIFRHLILIAAALAQLSALYAQEPATGHGAAAKPVLWEPVEISGRDLFAGPGAELRPELKKVKYLGRQTGGNNLKHRIEDGNGIEWVVKVADESQPEIAATRLLWAVGYKTEIDHMVKRLSIEKIGSYKNARFEARPKHIKRLERWSWTDNPFVGTKEFDGLKIMMALVNNWDLKDENTVVLQDGDRQYYVVSDLGASFGKLADRSMSRSGRSVNKPEDYASSGFIKEVRDGVIVFDYRGMNENLMQGIKVENARWIAEHLNQLSDKQIEDAFRAANYKPEDVQILAGAVKARIKALDDATRQGAVTES